MPTVTPVERPSGPVPGRTSAAAGLPWKVALGAGLVLVGLLVALPGLETLDETAPATLPGPGTGAWWACLATVVAQVAALLAARRLPRATPLAVAGLTLPLAVAGAGDLFSLTGGAVTVAVFLAVLVAPLPTLVLPLLGTALLVVLGEAVNAVAGGTAGVGGAVTTGLLQAVGTVVLPLLVAALVASRRDTREARRQTGFAADREREALVRAAVADERTAMARELHDIAAHHLSGIAVMAAAIERQIDTDPARAKESVRLVRGQSTAVLDDLRRLVGLLRTETDATRAVHSLEGLPELVATTRAAGTPVELRVLVADGAQLGDGVGPIAQLAAYQIVQESLANATRHSPGAAVVVEVDDRTPSTLDVTVTNAPPEHVRADGRPGFGLVGMRERADLIGATLVHGPTPEGGWRVHVAIPKDVGAAGLPPYQQQHRQQDRQQPEQREVVR